MPLIKSPKKLKGITSVNLPIFGSYVLLSMDETQHEQIMNWLNIEHHNRPSEEMFSTCAGFCCEYESLKGGHCVVVQVNDWMLDTLVHELAHATFMICDRKGIEVDSGDRETFCYIQDYLFNDFFKSVTERWELEESKKEEEE